MRIIADYIFLKSRQSFLLCMVFLSLQPPSARRYGLQNPAIDKWYSTVLCNGVINSDLSLWRRSLSMISLCYFEPMKLHGCDQCNTIWRQAYGIRGIIPQDHRLFIRVTRYSAIPLESVLFEGIVDGDRFTKELYTAYYSILTQGWSRMDNASIYHVGHGATVHFFADANPLFALIPESTNQPLRNSYITIVYGVIRYN